MAYPHSFELYQRLAAGSYPYPKITPHLCRDPRTCVRQQLVDRAAAHHLVADHPERRVVKRLRLVLRHCVERGRLGHQHPAPVDEAHDVDMPGRDLERQVQLFRGAPPVRRLDDLLEHAPVHRQLRVAAAAHEAHRDGAALRDAREHLARPAVRRPQRTADPAAENDRWPHHSSGLWLAWRRTTWTRRRSSSRSTSSAIAWLISRTRRSTSRSISQRRSSPSSVIARPA